MASRLFAQSMRGWRWSTWLTLVLVVAALYAAWPKRMTWIRSRVNGTKYYVKNLPGAQDVADRLATLEARLRTFLDDAERYAPGDPRLANIRQRWDGTLAETLNDKEVAYSLGKDAISVCVRTPDNGGPSALESENTGMFVLLHELAHVATDEYGHTPSFWANMKLLLELAEATGHYTYEDFDAKVTSYCGRRLAMSPLTCVKSKTCKSELGK